MGRYCKRDTKPLTAVVFKHLKDERGQSTVEYAIVAAAIIAIVVVLGILANNLEDGMFIQHALSAASHHIGASIGGVTDVFCY